MYPRYPSQCVSGRSSFPKNLTYGNTPVDSDFPGEFGFFIQLSLQLIAKLAAVLIYTPVFLFPGILIFLVGGWLGQIYMKAQLSVKREQSNAKAPVVGVFGGAIAGLRVSSISSLLCVNVADLMSTT